METVQMSEPKVVVGLPVYNDPEGLIRSVPTVFGQTWNGSLRVIAVDDGSTDDTPEVLKQLADLNSGIEVVRFETNLGRPAARNKIIELAGNDYLTWIDAGDLWHPRKLELQLATLLPEEQADPDTPLLCLGPLRWQFPDHADDRVRSSEVEGDQLRNALVGELRPYLQGILARAEHFRNAGGFDERLLRRQDYDFLVRFVASGGRVVSTPEGIPLFTYLKSDVGGSADAVAAANRVLRRKHDDYYRRYGRRLRGQIRNSQHRIVARFYRNNGRRVNSARYEALAAASSPGLTARRIGRRAWPPMKVAKSAARLPLRAIRPVLPVLQRTEVMEFARKIGVFRILAATGLTRSLFVDIKSQVEDTSGSSPTPTTRRGELPAEVEELEGHVATSEPTASPETWLRLERAYRRHSLLSSAESALRRGLEQHPLDSDLKVRLIELLALRRAWADCATMWSESDANELPLRGLTYARVARSFRELGQYQEALTIAEQGARQWPSDFRVIEELYIARAGLIDWKHALQPVESGQAAAAGAVTDLGFLSGTEDPLTGRVPKDSLRPTHLSLVVNGTPVASTFAATRSGEDWSSFSLSCHELRRYLGDGDAIWVESDGKPVAVEGGSTKYEVTTGYPSRFDELARALSAGHVFTKFGALRMGNTRERRKHTLALFDEVSRLVAESHGYETYPFYGHLLGAVREHDFIAHDAGGFDMGYVSRLSKPEEVRAEFMEICRMLLDHGYHLRLEPWSAYVRPIRTARIFVDLNYAWFNDDGELNLSFGWRGAPVTDQDRFFFPRESLIGDRLVRVPGNAEAVLDQIYGPMWPVPDQGFVLESDVVRNEAGILTPDEMRLVEQYDPDRVQAILDHHPDG
jgi:glycosyltransferase involved in cell wall biosynthesis/tetratricopeptide (TPR) repeat protein